MGNGITKIILSIGITYIYTHWLFDLSLMPTIFVFVIILEMFRGGKNEMKVRASKKIISILIALVVIGMGLIVTGKWIVNSDGMVIVGAILFCIIVPTSFVIINKIMKRKGVKVKN